MKDHHVKPIEEAVSTDSMLLRAALDDDQAAWQKLVETYFGPVYRWARNAGLQDCDAVEVANEVFASVAKALPKFRHSAESDTFRGWLRRITQHVIADWWRAQQRLPSRAAGGSDNQQLLNDVAIIDAISSIRQSKPSPEKLAVERVRACVRTEAWRIFWLATAEEMSPEDVAAECGVSVNVVYLTKHRIAKQIRRELEAGDDISSGGGCDHDRTNEWLS
ncbi:MAG TPA: sigma-70 family RNA polymerase sigma factor [Tepidisphaeraceae bacterium]|jgi:RNA polymerase sigma factor (sigma-70 family)|nr:sigma-70 family RNA polymerase sigma factor [Tepidisphaeraceae bacterium]